MINMLVIKLYNLKLWVVGTGEKSCMLQAPDIHNLGFYLNTLNQTKYESTELGLSRAEDV